MKENSTKTSQKVSRKSEHKKWIFCYALLAYPILLFMVFSLGGIARGILLAFQNVDFLGNYFFVGVENFKNFIQMAFADGDVIGISLWNSIRGFLLSLLINLPLCIIFAYMMFRKVPGYGLITLIFLLPSIVSSFIYTLVFRNFASDGLQEMMGYLGFPNFPNLMEDPKYSFGLTCGYGIWCGFGMTLIVFSNAIKSIDTQIIESAKVDGMATIFQEMRYIILPLIMPTVSTYLVTGVGLMFTSAGYVQAFYFANAPIETYNMGYWMWQRVYTSLSNGKAFGIVSAGGLLISLVSLPITFLVKWWANRCSDL